MLDVTDPALSCAEGRAVRRVQYVTPIKRQIIGPDKAACIERYESSGPPDAGFLVNVHVQTPKVCLPGVWPVSWQAPASWHKLVRPPQPAVVA